MENGAWWEILPQAASEKDGEVILSKRHELGLLSNFTAAPFTFRGKKYASMEGFWQAMLFPEGKNDPRAKLKYSHTRTEVEQMVAFEAKEAGDAAKANMKKLGIDWVTFEGKRMTYRTMEKGEHYRLIRQGMMAKMEQNPKVREVLLATKGLLLKPDHTQTTPTPPAWQYHKIWMEIRDSQAH